MKKVFILFSFIIICGSSNSQTFSWNGLEPIFDNETDTISIIVSGLPNTINNSFGIAHICIDIAHTNDSSLFIRLVAPNNSIVTLIQSIGGKGDNFTGTCMGMDGTDFGNASPPFTGLFEPVGDVSSFNNGQNPNGTWRLLVSDLATGDTGSVRSVSIAFTNNPPGSNGSGPAVNTVWPNALCPGGAYACDLLPDMTSSYRDIFLNHSETPGFLDISNTTPNIGYGPIEIYGIDSCFCGTTHVPCGSTCPTGNIKRVLMQRIYQKVTGTDTLSYYDRPAGLMTYHPTHGHLHVDNWAYYTLRTATSNPDATTWPIIGTGTKLSFCLINLGTCNGTPGMCLDNNGDTVRNVPNQNLGFNTGCGLTQGIFPGNYDVYSMSLNDPIILNNVCNGNYYIVSITDPENNFVESDETNNWVAVPITLTQQNSAPTITPGGPTTFCSGGSVLLTSSVKNNYLWSTGATTQSIVVSTSGSYNVSTNCGASVSTSSPVLITVVNLNVSAVAIPATSACNGDTVQLSVTHDSYGTQAVPVILKSNQQVFIPDNNSTGVTSTINVSGINPATVSTTSVVSVKLNLTHTYDGDLAISLISPSGNSRFLSNRRGGSGNNFINTVFTMSAATLISAGSPPFTGSYKPDGSLSTISGDVNGNWQLKVQDLASTDTGRIQNWSITINNIVTETFNYSWTSFPVGLYSSVKNPLINPTASAAYNVTVTSNASGCTGTNSVSVIVPENISISGISPQIGFPGSVVSIAGSGFDNVTSVSIAGVLAVSYSVINSNLIHAIVPSDTGSNVVCVMNAGNCTYCSTDSFTISSAGVSLNLKLFIEGLYISGGQMQSVINPLNYPTLCDTIFVELRSPNAPYSAIFNSRNTIDIFGNGTFLFPAAAQGNSYYISVRHRNSLEVWSSNLVLFTGPSVNYDFSTDAGMSFGNNLVILNDGNFAIYSGDVNQNGTIDIADYTSVEVAAGLLSSGYLVDDITGDGCVESSDYSLVENNIGKILAKP